MTPDPTADTCDPSHPHAPAGPRERFPGGGAGRPRRFEADLPPYAGPATPRGGDLGGPEHPPGTRTHEAPPGAGSQARPGGGPGAAAACAHDGTMRRDGRAHAPGEAARPVEAGSAPRAGVPASVGAWPFSSHLRAPGARLEAQPHAAARGRENVGEVPAARAVTGARSEAPARGSGAARRPLPRAGKPGGRQPRHRGVRERVGVVLAGADVAGALAGAVVTLPRSVALGGVVAAGLLVAQHKAGLHRPGFAPAALAELPGLAGRAALVWGLLAAVAAPGAGDLPALARAVAVTVAVAGALRAGVYGWRRQAARRRPASTLVVGPDAASAAHIAAVLHARPEYGLRPVGLATPAPVRPAPPEGPTASPRPPGMPTPARPGPPAYGDARSAGSGRPMRPPTPLRPTPAGPPAQGDPHGAWTARAAKASPQAGPSTQGRATSGGTSGAAGVPAPDVPAGPGGGVPAPVLPVLPMPGDVTRAVIQNAVRHAVVTGPATLDARTTATVRLLAAQGCVLWHVEGGGARPGRKGAAHLWGHACRRLDPYPPAAGRLGRDGKRALDAAVAAVALLCLAPLLAACALAVRFADGPGVLFRQERIGLHGRPFTLLKFRTLRPADDHESATRWTVAGDQRMSRAGRLLRRTSLDELPQLWNVLRGDMSLVGPRPERPYFVAQFSQTLPGYADRHRMPAGLTGLAQVHGLRGDTSIADRARFDNHYIDSWTLWQDVSILLRTAVTLFRHGGS